MRVISLPSWWSHRSTSSTQGLSRRYSGTIRHLKTSLMSKPRLSQHETNQSSSWRRLINKKSSSLRYTTRNVSCRCKRSSTWSSAKSSSYQQSMLNTSETCSYPSSIRQSLQSGRTPWKCSSKHSKCLRKSKKHSNSRPSRQHPALTRLGSEADSFEKEDEAFLGLIKPPFKVHVRLTACC